MSSAASLRLVKTEAKTVFPPIFCSQKRVFTAPPSDLAAGRLPVGARRGLPHPRDRREGPAAAEHHHAHEVPRPQTRARSQDMQHH